MNYTRYLAEPADITNVEVQHRATFRKTLNFLFSPLLICCWSRMPCTALSLSGAHVCGHDLNIGHLTRPRPKIGPICFCILFVFVFARSQYIRHLTRCRPSISKPRPKIRPTCIYIPRDIPCY